MSADRLFQQELQFKKNMAECMKHFARDVESLHQQVKSIPPVKHPDHCETTYQLIFSTFKVNGKDQVVEEDPFYLTLGNEKHRFPRKIINEIKSAGMYAANIIARKKSILLKMSEFFYPMRGYWGELFSKFKSTEILCDILKEFEPQFRSMHSQLFKYAPVEFETFLYFILPQVLAAEAESFLKELSQPSTPIPAVAAAPKPTVQFAPQPVQPKPVEKEIKANLPRSLRNLSTSSLILSMNAGQLYTDGNPQNQEELEKMLQRLVEKNIKQVIFVSAKSEDGKKPSPWFASPMKLNGYTIELSNWIKDQCCYDVHILVNGLDVKPIEVKVYYFCSDKSDSVSLSEPAKNRLRNFKNTLMCGVPILVQSSLAGGCDYVKTAMEYSIPNIGSHDFYSGSIKHPASAPKKAVASKRSASATMPAAPMQPPLPPRAVEQPRSRTPVQRRVASQPAPIAPMPIAQAPIQRQAAPQSAPKPPTVPNGAPPLKGILKKPQPKEAVQAANQPPSTSRFNFAGATRQAGRNAGHLLGDFVGAARKLF